MKSLFVLLTFLFFPLGAFGVDCSELKTQALIQDLLRQSKRINPISSERISVMLELSACEDLLCRPEHVAERLEKVRVVHVLKMGDNRRINIVQGADAQQCFIRRAEREFRCLDCGIGFNRNCRSYKSDNLSLLQGTNIDFSDFELLAEANYQQRCMSLDNNQKFFMIQSISNDPDLPFERIESYFEKKRTVPILVRFYHRDRLVKVYRFFPDHFAQFEKQWYSTLFRVRSVQGDENRYQFETMVRIAKDAGGAIHLFTNPMQDPFIRLKDHHEIFATD